ncbi:ABC transporter ATP-binding protein [Paramicrobacterium chengjingii]|uniref:Energy-coupling factor ABC transporter ATP-binding protein n=1 Tax=Paramicrobacterium chengjingii TaxID=2769067 RepID=A0ABX6YFT5_9MICO|nr:ABC transporter ATP-binding protein [Microbacterium chengjingii]QPZ37657.1 energy-coupling factor ABC transporter ATP-binding protein [Microbacterium chengjingii]
MPARALTLDDVRIRHADRTAHVPAGVTLSVDTGEVVLLLGPSGCGKSTAALAINGLVPQSIPATLEGTISACGIDVSTTTTARLSEHVAMVFQDPDAQIVSESVLDEVCFALENMLLPVTEILSRAEDALRTVGLWGRREDCPDILSGGARQRLAIACALAMHTSILVLDEPTANLDPSGSDDVYAVLRRVTADGDRSVVLIEHDVDAALPIVDRVVILDRDGRTAFTGTPREVFAGHSREIASLGVWLPTATMVAHRLETVGVALDPVPLSMHDLGTALADVQLPALRQPLAVPPRGEQLIRVRDLTITRGDSVLLDRVSLDVHEGDFLAVIGANGAGKTTLIQAMTGVARPPKRHVSLAGVDAATRDARALAQRVGFVFQNPEHQFVANTVADELAYGLRVHGDSSGRRLEPHEIDDSVDTMLARLGLSAHRDMHPFLLSGGQKRRLSVGTALIVGAPILALDEPTFGQDRERADELMAMFQSLRAEGTTIIVVSHDMQLVAEYATRVVVLSHGAVAADGSAASILSDDTLLRRNSLRQPPLARAMSSLDYPEWNGVTRFADLPGARA